MRPVASHRRLCHLPERPRAPAGGVRHQLFGRRHFGSAHGVMARRAEPSAYHLIRSFHRSCLRGRLPAVRPGDACARCHAARLLVRLPAVQHLPAHLRDPKRRRQRRARAARVDGGRDLAIHQGDRTVVLRVRHRLRSQLRVPVQQRHRGPVAGVARRHPRCPARRAHGHLRKAGRHHGRTTMASGDHRAQLPAPALLGRGPAVGMRMSGGGRVDCLQDDQLRVCRT